MKETKKIFENVPENEIQTVFAKYGLCVDKNMRFSDLNIVIGVNGGGKTRFLKAIRELYERNGQNDIIYCYFPDISVNKSPTEEKANSVPEDGFSDFLKEIEQKGIDFLSHVILGNEIDRKLNKIPKAMFEKKFKELTGYSLSVKNRTISVEQEGKRELLSDKIKTFSPGQLMLFYISIFFSLQIDDDEKIIILDEPECHLHPSALIQFIKDVSNLKNLKHIWIATHSLFILPEFQFENMIYMKNGKVFAHNRNLYHDILEDMLGQYHSNTSLFLSSITQWQYSQFMAECFLNPTVVCDVNPEDEQVRKFINFISKTKKLSILDFGGGEARLGLSIAESDYQNKDKIKYEIYDLEPIGDQTKSGYIYYSKMTSVPNGRYDFVVMMNVLHEIDPKEWVKIFKSIYEKMAYNSYLVFSEVHTLSLGEKPNDKGYLILGEEELQVLFGTKKLAVLTDKNSKNKTICIAIPKEYLLNVSEESVNRALKELEKKSYAMIQHIRNNANEPRQYAFWTQLYLNAKLYNESVTKNEPITKGREQQDYINAKPYNKSVTKDEPITKRREQQEPCSGYEKVVSPFIALGNGQFVNKNRMAHRLLEEFSKIPLQDEKIFDLYSLSANELKKYLNGEDNDIGAIFRIQQLCSQLGKTRVALKVDAMCCFTLAIIKDNVISQTILVRCLEYLPSGIKNCIVHK